MTKLSMLLVAVGFAGFLLSAYGCTRRVARENAKSQYWLLAPITARPHSVRELTRWNRMLSSGGMAFSLLVVAAVVAHPIGH